MQERAVRRQDNDVDGNLALDGSVQVRSSAEHAKVFEYPAPKALRIEPAAHAARTPAVDGQSYNEPLAAEQYRRLAGALVAAQPEHGLKVVMIASATQGEGKSVTAANLALTLAKSYRRRVLLVDADLRLPTQHEIFRAQPAHGLTEFLDGAVASVTPAAVVPNLMLLPAGRPSADPVGGLTSSRMRRLLEEASGAFDWVILDTPPVALMPDANLLTSMVDGVVLVTEAGRTAYPVLARAVSAIGRERILGTVLNRVSEDTVTAQYGQYAGY